MVMRPQRHELCRSFPNAATKESFPAGRRPIGPAALQHPNDGGST